MGIGRIRPPPSPPAGGSDSGEKPKREEGSTRPRTGETQNVRQPNVGCMAMRLPPKGECRITMKTSTNENERRPEEKTPPKKAWRKPALAEIDLEDTETGIHTGSDYSASSS